MRYILNKKDCSFLGKGKEGEVYLTPEGYALKIFYRKSKAISEVKLLEIASGSRFFPNVLFIANNMVLRDYVEGITLREYIRNNGLSFNLSCEIIELVEEFKNLNFKRINIRNAHIFVNEDEKIQVIDPRKVFSKNTPYPKDIVKILVQENLFEDFLKHVLEYEKDLSSYWVEAYDYYIYHSKKSYKINMK